MKTHGWTAVAAAAALVATTATTATMAAERGFARDMPQERMGQSPHCPAEMGQLRQQNWQELKLETIVGRITDVRVEPNCMHEQQAVHWQVTSDGTAYLIHLGPARFIKDTKYRFAIGDEVTVTGVRADAGQDAILIATKIVKGEQTWMLRDQQGRPFWRGGRGASGMGPRVMSH